ncbi:mucin apoprotein precursor [Diplodia corticola]|uniref:Mucin apoprotein n=1 Tax=Diplodia corticola TaxID=236234 RepID=A0A1J9R396_9PEZI|nr:mucin apoprotein precursor [Diplodia corticola]OJD35902.1 mucin apoprotein precursor [Diplodia corticola]
MGAAESKAVAASGGNTADFAATSHHALAGFQAQVETNISPDLTTMGNNTSVPAQGLDQDADPALPDLQSTEHTEHAEPVQTDGTNDLQQSTPSAESEPVPAELSSQDRPSTATDRPTTATDRPSTATDRFKARDNRPAFLRRLTIAPSAVSTAAAHHENVSAGPVSSSPAERQAIGAKEHLTKSNASIARVSPPMKPAELAVVDADLEQQDDQEHVAAASITLPPSRPSTSCSVSSLGSAVHDFVSHAQWEAMNHAGGDVSPLDRSRANSPVGSFREQQSFNVEEGTRTFDERSQAGSVALSEGDASWRRESWANRDGEHGETIDMTLETMRRNSIPASVATAQTFGSFAHPFEDDDDDESCFDDDHQIRPEYLPLPDDATDGTADDELSMSMATVSDIFEKRYSTGVTTQMTNDVENVDDKAAHASQSPAGEPANAEDELDVEQTGSDTEVDKATTVGNVDDVGVPEGDVAASDDISETHVTASNVASGAVDDGTPLEFGVEENSGSAAQVPDSETPTAEQITASNDTSPESVEQLDSAIEAVEVPTAETKEAHPQPEEEDAAAADPADTMAQDIPEPAPTAENAQDALAAPAATDAGDAATTTEAEVVEVQLNSIKEPTPTAVETRSSIADLSIAAAAAAPENEETSAPAEDLSLQSVVHKVIDDAPLVADPESTTIDVTAFPADEALAVHERDATEEQSEESIADTAAEIRSKINSPHTSTSQAAESVAAESVSLRDMLQETTLVETLRDNVGSGDEGSGASLALAGSAPQETRRDGGEAGPCQALDLQHVSNAGDDDGWAIPDRDEEEPQAQAPVRSRRKSLPLLFRDMKDSRKEKKSHLPVKKEAKEAKAAVPSKKDGKPVLSFAAVKESRIPAAPLSAPMEPSRMPFSPGKKGRNVLHRNPPVLRHPDQPMPSPTTVKEKKKRSSLLGVVFGRSMTPTPDLEKERERQIEKLNKERAKEQEKAKEAKPKKDSKSKLVIPQRRYSLAGPLGGHDHHTSFHMPRLPTPKRVQEISGLSRQEATSRPQQERPRSGSQSLDSLSQEGASSPSSRVARVSAAVDANHRELQSHMRRPSILPEPDSEWDEWEQKARELDDNRTKVNGSPASQISIPAVLHGPGTPTQAKLHPQSGDGYPFYQYAPPPLPPHMQTPPRSYYGNAPRSAAFNEPSLQRRYSEHFSSASARGLPPFPPRLYGLRDAEYAGGYPPMRQSSQPHLRPQSGSGSGPSSPNPADVAPFIKDEDRAAPLSASPVASNVATVDSFEGADPAYVPPPVPLPGETMEEFLAKQRAWYEQHAQAANRRDSGYSPQYNNLPPQAFYPYPPPWYWGAAQGYPPHMAPHSPMQAGYPPFYPPAPTPPVHSHAPEDYYHQALREQHAQERAASSDADSPRDKSPLPSPYGAYAPHPGFGPPPRSFTSIPSPAPAAPYGYHPRQDMRWRDLTSATDDGESRHGAAGQKMSHKRIDSGLGQDATTITITPTDEDSSFNEKPRATSSAGKQKSPAGTESGHLVARRATVSTGGLSRSASKLETVMEPVELADTDVGLKNRSGASSRDSSVHPVMHASSYPGMEWMPDPAAVQKAFDNGSE